MAWFKNHFAGPLCISFHWRWENVQPVIDGFLEPVQTFYLAGMERVLTFESDPAFPVLQSSCWLLTDFLLLKKKKRELKKTIKKYSRPETLCLILCEM